MPAFQINDEEREALRGLPMLAREVYVFGLRPFMDYATGIVGIKRGVSWKSIAEELYVEPHQGIKGGEPSEKELRRALAWLQRVGLLSENRAERRLVFELLQASRDQSARNKVGSKWADEAGSYVAGQEASNGTAFQQKEGMKVAGGEVPKVGTPPVSGIPPTTLSAREAPDAQHDTRQRFAMHDDWQPSARGWKATLMRNGLGNTSLGPDALMEFRSYWINRPEKHQTQGQWEHDLAQSMKRGYRHEQANGRSTQAGAHQERTKSSRVGQRPLSAVEQVDHAIEQQRIDLAKSCGAVTAGADGEALEDDGGNLRPPLDGEFWPHPEA